MSETSQQPDLFPYWLKGEAVVNFGDYLTEIFLDRLLLEPKAHDRKTSTWQRQIASIRLVGSTIGDWFVDQDSEQNGPGDVVFWGCGLREHRPISNGRRPRVKFHGVRGPLTRDVLGLPVTTTLGDPGLLIPLLHQPARYGGGGRVVFPHFLETMPTEKILAISGADRVCHVRLAPRPEEFFRLVDQIAAADLVLTGALHVAIVAHAYGRPFAYWGGGYVDIPFKWMDFAASIGIGSYFVPDVILAAEIYVHAIAPYQRKLPLVPLLGSCPLHVRPSMLFKAQIYDLQKGRDPLKLGLRQRMGFQSARPARKTFRAQDPDASTAGRYKSRLVGTGIRALAPSRPALRRLEDSA